MKSWRLTLKKKNGKGRTTCLYVATESEEDAKKYFERFYSRSNELVSIIDITYHPKGKRVRSKAGKTNNRRRRKNAESRTKQSDL